MSFAAIEARATASIFKVLANAEAIYTPEEGEPIIFPIVFDAAMGVIDDLGVQTLAPSFDMQPAAFAGLEEGLILSIRGNSYRVRSVTPLAEGGYQRVALAKV